jgi:hypothetical protein
MKDDQFELVMNEMDNDFERRKEELI